MVLVLGIPKTILLFCLFAICSAAKPSNNVTCDPKSYPKNSSITPVSFATKLSDLHWLGFDSDADKYVVALTDGVGFEAGGDVYRSDNHGAASSWKNISGDLKGLLDPANHTHGFLRGAVALHHHPRSAEKVLIQGAAHHNWISDDFGSLWHQVDSPGQTLGYWTQIKIHPFQHDWMLALVRRHECHREAASLDKWCASDLFVTQDFGNTWTNLTANSQGRIASFVDFDWGAYLQPWNPDRGMPKDETIFATAYEDAKHMKGPLPSWDKNVHFVQSHDFFKTAHEKIVSCGNQFDIISHKIYLALPSNCPYGPEGNKRKLTAAETVSSSVIMYVSDDEGTTFTEACIPVGDLDLGYRMQSNFFGEGAFIMIDHSSQDVASSRAPISNVYSSGGNSSLFSLALPRAFRRGQHVDFAGVDGLPGMYIANSLGLSALEDAAFRWDTELTDYEKFVQTRVSYNGGAHWHLLTQPEQFNFPGCDRCSKLNESWSCQLHLHGPSSWHATEGKMPGLHSHISAPGIVMAVGNTGEYLDFAADATCTFLSRDGGETWQDIANHANVFDFGDQGGLLVMARHQTQGPADHVQFSMDEGRCWHTVNLSEAINIIGLRVEPTASSHVFLVYGEACEQSEHHPTCSHTEQGTRPAGKLYAIDFQELMGEDWRVCEDDQYEKWSVPTDERCLLGRNITMTRRKQDSACFNGKGWQRPEGIHEYCDCDWVDVECEYGYEWSWHHNACVEMIGVDLQTCPKIKDGRYVISETHARLLNGDMCMNISRLINDTDGRGHSTLPRGRFMLPKWALVAIALLVAVAVVTGAAMYLQHRTHAGAGYAEDTGGAGPLSAVGSAIGWVKSKLPGSGRSENDYFQPLSGSNDEFGVNEEDAQSPTRHP